MREIKFRAWDHLAKKMRGLGGKKDLFLIRSDGVAAYHYHLMQFTGLKDKNGIEIYEGDILKSTNFANPPQAWLNVVKWIQLQWAFPLIGKESSGSGMPLLHAMDRVEVVGNIFENPELLPNSAL